MGSSRRALAGLYGRATGTVEGAEEAESAAWASRPDRRSYLLGIRPQNSLSSSRFSPSSLGRSTFCAIISQLTEETQPLFESTIQSRAVSEHADAKFTCVVTGFPQPEVTWYKDDEEMDRYCGLPKYQIFRHGNRHTLQLYKCREEDAGIYQASARNTKGIVSCSGVLEVGTMTEFKIHQRWFDKIKRKAEEKLREIEQGKKREKEDVEVERLQGMSPDRLQRKRRLAWDRSARSGAPAWEEEDAAKVHVADSRSRLQEDIAELQEQPAQVRTGFSNKLVAPLEPEVTANGDASLESVEEGGHSFLQYMYETVEGLAAQLGPKDSAAKKKKKKVEAAPAAKLEADTREEGGRERAQPAPNPRFGPAVASHRSTRPRAASEAESSTKAMEPGHAAEQCTTAQGTAAQGTTAQGTMAQGTLHFSLKEMFFDKQGKASGQQQQQEEAAEEEAASKPVLQPATASRHPEDAASASERVQEAPVPPQECRGRHHTHELEANRASSAEASAAVGQPAGDLQHTVSAPVVETSQQSSKLAEPRKELPACQDTTGAARRTNPHLRSREPPKPPAPSADHVQSSKEHHASGKQAEGHSHALEGRETKQGLLNQKDKSQGEEEPLPKKPSPPRPGEKTPLEQITPQAAVENGESKEVGAELARSHSCAQAGGSRAAEPSPGAVHRLAAGTPLGHQETGMSAIDSVQLVKEKSPPAPAAGMATAQEAAAHSAPGMEAPAGQHPAAVQSLPPASREAAVKKADGSAPQEFNGSAPQQEFSASVPWEDSAKPVPAGLWEKEGGEQTATAPCQEPAAPSGTLEGGAEVQPQVPLVLPSPKTPQEMSLEEKMQHKNLVSSLKNYLLLLLKMSDSGKDATKEAPEPSAQEQPGAEEALPPEIGIAGLSPRTSRRVLEKVQNNQLLQTAESLPLTPRTSRRITGMINQELLTSQEMLSPRPVPPKRRPRPAAEAEGPPHLSVPSIVVGSEPGEGAGQAPHGTSRLGAGSCEEGAAGSAAALPCATPEELASGARRKIFLPRAAPGGQEGQAAPQSPGLGGSPAASPGHAGKGTALAASPPVERRLPAPARKMDMLEVPRLYQQPAGDSSGDHEVPEDAKPEAQPAEPKQANNPFKAPQVIRKIRAEQFSDASGNLKLWCQFFNILSDSKLMWYKDETPVAEAHRSAGDESQVALAVVQASPRDCGAFRCVLSNEHGTAATHFLLSPEVLSGLASREETEAVGEEIEMTPMVFAKGLADAGYWGDKLFGRVVSEDTELPAGPLRKACRARAIYGLEPLFESGCTCIIKVHNFIVFGTKNENSLVEKNYDITIQECKVQNSSREYCKIFAAEARAAPGFGAVPEILPLYLVYRPANNIPYATMEEDLGAPCQQYCATEKDGSLVVLGTSEVVLKCCTFQHWVYQWTNGNILVTDMEGVGWKVTNVRIATNLKGYQGLKESCFPSLLEQFAATHRCNHYCSILGLKTLEPAKPKGSRSPSMGRKSAQSSPQLQKKGLASPQGVRKAALSPKASPRAVETREALAGSKAGSGERGRAGPLQ
ncbi:alpha-protein kinase 3 [Indicator indicator]|uniref:alpha-protein kinase 3 n=1 Tax=Indicator indicator TaxID=1002788 RepID=UPI0023E0014E|nr:alpha-protein kinase 3 [Indicator indicator]